MTEWKPGDAPWPLNARMIEDFRKMNLEEAEAIRQKYPEGVADEVKRRVNMICDAAIKTLSPDLHVHCGSMHESNGRVTWLVTLSKDPDPKPWDCHEIYSSASEGRARYEAARLKSFLGQGPKPDILAFDTDLPPAVDPAPIAAQNKAKGLTPAMILLHYPETQHQNDECEVCDAIHKIAAEALGRLS